MDHDKLRTASSYLNNLLLARGLLRNGEPVDFVKPSKDSRAQIINLVHDLILREDREREQREHVAVTIRNLRSEDARKSTEIEKLREKGEESARNTVQARAAERAAKEECKKVERAMKSLQEQTARLKASLAQVKTQCANDVRKRDLEISRLKSHLQGQQRGNKIGMAAPSMTITGAARRRERFDASVRELGDPEYSLKQETTEFLTQLSQSLSDENDSLISLVRNALETMRELLGISANGEKPPDSAIGSMQSNEDGKHVSGHGMLNTLPSSYETLAADLESMLTLLKNVLSNPNFVTLEEVEVRDEEIARLREGWERMESRWRDVLVMMEGWRRRMDTGETINLEDLRLGMGLVSPVRERNGRHPPEVEENFIEGDDPSEVQLPGIEEEEEEASVMLEPSRMSSLTSQSSPKRKRDILEPPEFFDLRPASSKSVPASPERKAVAPMQDDAEEAAYEDESEQLPMTLEEKLHAAQAEAEEAAAVRAAAKARAASELSPENRASAKKPAKIASRFGLDGAAEEEEDEDDTLGKLVASPMVKKTKIKGRPRRRKSTLNPEELEELLMSAE